MEDITSNLVKTTDVFINNTLLPVLDVSDIITKIITDRVNESEILNFIFTQNTPLSKPIIINKKNIIIDYNGFSVTSGDFNAVQIKGIRQDVGIVSSFDNDEIIVVNNTIINSGDYVRVYKTNSECDLVTCVLSAIPTLIKVADIPNFIIDGDVLKAEKIENMNIVVKNGEFSKTTTQTNNYDVAVIECVGVTVKNNKFKNAYGLATVRSGYCNLLNNSFVNTQDSIFMSNICSCNIKKNTFNQSKNGIRTQLIYNCVIDSNEVVNGLNQEISVGIEISSITLQLNKASSNKITNNKCIGVQLGRLGSVIGGIHLKFNSHHNTVSGNTCNKNSIGIYLENKCGYNIITNNECCFNAGYYGVGIELDWQCHCNIISNNICSNNNGQISADESCGIEVRCGINDVTNLDIGNIVSNNTCTYNGKAGIMMSGRGTIISGNTLFGNGTNTGFQIRAELISTKAFENCSKSVSKASFCTNPYN